MIYLIVLIVFIINIIGCAGTHTEFLFKKEWKPDEVPKDNMVYITLKDGSTHRFSSISFEGTKLIGKLKGWRSGVGSVLIDKEIEIQDIQYMWTKKYYADTSATIFTFLAGFVLTFFITMVVFYLSGHGD